MTIKAGGNAKLDFNITGFWSQSLVYFHAKIQVTQHRKLRGYAMVRPLPKMTPTSAVLPRV